MEEHGDEIEKKNESFAEKIHHHDSSSSSDSDSEKKKVEYDEDVKEHHDAPPPKSKSNRLFGREKPVHQVLGGGKPADVLLWRNMKISASVVGGATALWVLFEVLEYHLLPLVCHILILVFTVLFLWSNASKVINKSSPQIPQVKIPEDSLVHVVGAIRIEINHFLDMLRHVSSGKDLKKFITVVFGLWIVSIVGRWCNFLTLFYITFVVAHTVPVLYEKYEDEVDAFGEKAMIEMKKQYAVLDNKVLSKIPLKTNKRD